jgi:protein AaeX
MNLIKLGKIREVARQRPSGMMLWRAAVAMNLIFLTGCRGAPSINLLGSFFPGWMLCIILGVIGALLLRQVFIKINIDAHLPLPGFVYFCLWVSITLLSWLLFFRS